MTEKASTARPAATLIAKGPRVVNVGLARFAEDLSAQEAAVVHVDWSPPAGGDARLARLLAKLGS